MALVIQWSRDAVLLSDVELYGGVGERVLVLLLLRRGVLECEAKISVLCHVLVLSLQLLSRIHTPFLEVMSYLTVYQDRHGLQFFIVKQDTGL